MKRIIWSFYLPFLGVFTLGILLRVQTYGFDMILFHELQSRALEELPSVAICASIQDEYLNVIEWVKYHLVMGIEKFYIGDNNSSSSQTFDVLFPFIQNDTVEYFYVPEQPSIANNHIYIYTRCIQKFAGKHNFMAFIGVDEYIVVKTGLSIPKILKNYIQYGGVTLNWMVFGSSGHITRPNGTVLGSYWKCIESYHIETIVNCKYVTTENVGIHNFNYTNGYYAVDTNRNKVLGQYNPRLHENLDPSLFNIMYINHYVTRSWEDFQRKRQRAVGAGHKVDHKTFHFANNRTTKDCPVLKRNHF